MREIKYQSIRDEVRGWSPQGAISWTSVDVRGAFANEDSAMMIGRGWELAAAVGENPDAHPAGGAAGLHRPDRHRPRRGHGLQHAVHAASDMEDLVTRGFTGVLHTFSENDLNWYRGQMERIVAVSHELGLEVQVGPWGLAHVFGGEAESLFMTQHPELGQVFADGRHVGAGCPSRPELLAFAKHWASAAVELGADRVFWDEPHWAHPVRFGQPRDAWSCVCDACQAGFQERFGHELPREPTDEVLSFREQVLTDFVRELVAHVDATGGRSTVCLLPAVDGLHAVDTWEPVASAPGLDTLATDPYWSFFDQEATAFVGELSKRAVDLAGQHGLTPQIWIQGFKLGPEQVGEIHAAVAAARAAGVEDLWTWGYEACAHMSHLDTREPEVIWEELTEALTGGRRDG